MWVWSPAASSMPSRTNQQNTRSYFSRSRIAALSGCHRMPAKAALATAAQMGPMARQNSLLSRYRAALRISRIGHNG